MTLGGSRRVSAGLDGSRRVSAGLWVLACSSVPDAELQTQTEPSCAPDTSRGAWREAHTGVSATHITCEGELSCGTCCNRSSE